jgi:hypothetical protein
MAQGIPCDESLSRVHATAHGIGNALLLFYSLPVYWSQVQAGAFREELDRSLALRAGGDELRLARDRRWISVDRLLARLAAVAPDGWAVAGEFAVDARSLRTRVAEELSIEWRAKRAASFPWAPYGAAELDVGDFFGFELEMVGGMATRREDAQLFSVLTTVADEPFEEFRATLRLRYHDLEVERLRMGDLLAFAGMEAAEIDAIALELVAAERIHAYTAHYLRDWSFTAAQHLFELALIAEISGLKARLLLQATVSFFAAKGDTELLSECLAPPTETIAEMFERITSDLDFGLDAEAAHEEVSAMIDPVMSGEVSGASTWNAADRLWLPG